MLWNVLELSAGTFTVVVDRASLAAAPPGSAAGADALGAVHRGGLVPKRPPMVIPAMASGRS